MANDYVNQIQSQISTVKSQINTTLKNLYVEPKIIMTHDQWLKSKETNYINTISSLVKQYRSIVENMKQSFWGVNYKGTITDQFNSFIVGTNNQYNYFKNGYTSFFENTSFGKINESMWNDLLKEQIIHKTRITSIDYQLQEKNYMAVMSVGHFQLNYSMYALARDPQITIEEFKKYKATYYKVSRYFNIDVLCAELYCYHVSNKPQLLSDTVFDYINSGLVKTQKDFDILTSSLEWMKNEQVLKEVLEYMEDDGLYLSYDRKARLKQLSSVKFVDNHGFNISSSDKKINDYINSMRWDIKAQFSTFTNEPISYSIYIDRLLKNHSYDIDRVKNSLDALKKLNETYFIDKRDKLSSNEIQRLTMMWSNYYNFKNKNLQMIYPSVYLDNKAVNKEYMNEIMLLDSKNVKKRIDDLNKILDIDPEEYYWNQIWNYDVNELMKYAWNIALNSNPNNYKEFGSLFVYVKNLFYRLTRYFNIHMYLAQLQQDINLYGKDGIEYKINVYLQNKDIEKTKNDLGVLASFLEYHELMNMEKHILKLMVDSGMELDIYKAKRLNYLDNYNEDGPKKLEIDNKEQLHFDVSSIEWRDDDIHDFFKQLGLDKQVLDYSLAISLEDQDIVLGKGIQLPQLDIVSKQINENLDDEFDGEVSAKYMNASILSENIKEEIEGIYIDIDDCPSMKLFVNLMKVGKKLNIRFYTLYKPTNQDLNNQKNEFMALNKKISPSMSVWEKSVKDTVLLSLQHVLNNNVNSNGNRVNNDDF